MHLSNGSYGSQLTLTQNKETPCQMAILASEIGDEHLPFPPNMRAAAIFHACISSIGVFMTAFVSVAIIKSKQKKAQHYILISLCAADLLFGVVAGEISVVDSAMSGFSTGYLGCVFDGILALTGCGVSMLSLVILSLDKYVGIVCAQSKNPYLRKLKPLSVNQAIGVSLSVWVFIFGYACLPFAFGAEGYAYALQSSHLTCAWTWWDMKNPLVISGSVVTILVVVGGGILMGLIYYNLVYYVISFHKKTATQIAHAQGLQEVQVDDDAIAAPVEAGKNKVIKREATPKQNSATTSPEEKRLIINGLLISICFAFCWFPYVIKVLAEMATQSPISPAMDALVVCICALNPIINPMILVYFDLRVQKAFLDMLAIKTTPRFLQPPSFSAKTGDKKAATHSRVISNVHSARVR